MNILKISKYILPWVLCSSLLSACDGSDTTSTLADAQQQMMNPGASVWADMGKQFQLVQNQPRPEVLAQIHWMQANKDWLYPTLKTAAPYIQYVLAQTQKHKLPAELALLPIIESDYDPIAKSRVGASGVWQLMPVTAKDLGLKNSSDYDGRKDVVASTNAALNFLSDLHHTFPNDWNLTLAAYNYGPGNIQTAVKQQSKWYHAATFWNLTSLPKETQVYVPKLLALAAIIRDPARYGFTLPDVDGKTHLASIKVNSADELKQVVALSSASKEDLKKLNPAYQKLATTAGAPNTFLVPIENPALVLKPTTTTATATASDPQQNKSLINTLLWNGKTLVLALTSNSQSDNL